MLPPVGQKINKLVLLRRSARRIMLGTNSVDRPVDPLYYDLTEIIVVSAPADFPLKM